MSELIRLTGSMLSLVVVSEGSASIKSRQKSKKGRAKAFYEKVNENKIICHHYVPLPLILLHKADVLSYIF